MLPPLSQLNFRISQRIHGLPGILSGVDCRHVVRGWYDEVSRRISRLQKRGRDVAKNISGRIRKANKKELAKKFAMNLAMTIAARTVLQGLDMSGIIYDLDV